MVALYGTDRSSCCIFGRERTLPILPGMLNTHFYLPDTDFFLTCPVGQPRLLFHLPDREFHLPRAVGLVGLSTPGTKAEIPLKV